MLAAWESSRCEFIVTVLRMKAGEVQVQRRPRPGSARSPQRREADRSADSELHLRVIKRLQINCTDTAEIQSSRTTEARGGMKHFTQRDGDHFC